MSDFQIYLTLAVFAAVILIIAFNLLDMAVTTLLGISALIASGVLKPADIIAAIDTASGSLLLLFGGMVVAQTLSNTGIFERIGAIYLQATRGSGKRFLLLLVALVAPLCAMLPNATTVVLLAPIIIRVAVALEVDFVAPLILTAIISNSAGLLTLVGDPATFLVGSSIGMSFGEYLRTVSLGGLIALLAPLPLLPVLMPALWRTQRTLPPPEAPKPIERPAFVVLALMVLIVMVGLFLFGDRLPSPIVPPTAAFIAASLALLLIEAGRSGSVEGIIRDIDWKTLMFLGGIFVLVQAITKTGLLEALALHLYDWFGAALVPVALCLIAGIGLLSSLLANIPVVAASIVMVKAYLVTAEVVPEAALGAHFSDWPSATIAVFVAMMFGATLGGNATLIGASANIVAVGVSARNGRPVRFATWLRYGVPITVCQLLVSAAYVLLLFFWADR